MLLPRSPRKRRRLAWAAGLVAAGAGVVALALLIPSTDGTSKQTFSNAAVDEVATRDVPLRRTDKLEMMAVLRRFVATAVVRRDVAASYELAAPDLREGMTRAQWAKGDIPVEPFRVDPATETWEQLNFSYPNDVSFDALFQPQPGADVNGVAFTVEMKRVAGRWRVASLLPTAEFIHASKKTRFPMVKTQKDSSPSSQALRDNLHRRKISRAWYLLPAVLLGLVVLFPLGFGVVTSARNRRAAKRYASERKDLPPLRRAA